jgi:hypothetical protein
MLACRPQRVKGASQTLFRSYFPSFVPPVLRFSVWSFRLNATSDPASCLRVFYVIFLRVSVSPC